MYEHMFASGRTSCKEAVELGEHLVGFFEDVAPGVAAQLVAPAARVPLALAVPLPGVTGLVELVRVQLDDQPAARPTAVHIVGTGGPVRDRQLEAPFTQAGAEA